MARPRTFDEAEVISKAMLAFWQNGYESTSIGMLEEATGISRISLYNTFGDKSKLFLKALNKYSADALDYFQSESFTEGGLDSIIGLFESAAKKKPADAPEQFGCLMLNTILDIDSAGDEAKDIVIATRKAMIKGFSSAMTIAMSRGEMKKVTTTELKDRGDFLVGALWGGRMTVRLHGNVTMARGVARTVVTVVNSWRV